jgi:hypothetical protein
VLFDLGVGSRRPQGSARPLVWGRARLRAHHRRALHAARVPADEAIYFVGAEDLVSEREVVGVARIEGVDPERTEGRIRAVLEAQAKRWGGPLLNHPIYARRPAIFRGRGGCGEGWMPRASSNPRSLRSSTAG